MQTKRLQNELVTYSHNESSHRHCTDATCRIFEQALKQRNLARVQRHSSVSSKVLVCVDFRTRTAVNRKKRRN